MALVAPLESTVQSKNGEFIFSHYPPQAKAAGEQGAVRFQARVDAKGNVLSCKVTQGSGHERLDRETCELIVDMPASNRHWTKAARHGLPCMTVSSIGDFQGEPRTRQNGIGRKIPRGNRLQTAIQDGLAGSLQPLVPNSKRMGPTRRSSSRTLER